MRQPHVPNHPGDFDLRRPPCEAAARPQAADADLLLRYLGVGGVYLEWGSVALLTAPLFTRYGPMKVAVGTVAPDAAAVEAGLAGLPLERVRAVLVGHAHYDHVADVPTTLLDHVTSAPAYLNATGANMLAAFPELSPRLVVLEDHAGEWIRLRDDRGKPLPLRVRALGYAHAPHLRGIHFAEGEIDRPWETWDGKRLRNMKEGATFAFVIDLLADDGERTLFRIHYQDAAGVPPAPGDGRSVDLAVLPLAHRLVDGYPARVLRDTGARHAVLIHYEDFLRRPDRPQRFQPLLSNRDAARFLDAAEAAMTPAGGGPADCGCGPCGEQWTMPLPGEWLRFRVSD